MGSKPSAWPRVPRRGRQSNVSAVRMLQHSIFDGVYGRKRPLRRAADYRNAGASGDNGRKIGRAGPL